MEKSRNRSRLKPEVSKYFDPDPVLEQSFKDEKSVKKSKHKIKKTESEQVTVKPPLSKRVELTTHDNSIPPGAKYVPPKSRKKIQEYRERRQKYVEDLNFCKHESFKIPPPGPKTTLDVKLEAPSADIKEAKVMPHKTSLTPSALYPEPPDTKDLTQREPKSGTIINVSRRKRKIIKKVKRRKNQMPIEPTIEELIAQELATIQEMGEGEDFAVPPPENYLTKQFRRKVSQLSKSTSIKSQDYKVEEVGEEEDEKIEEEEDKFISTLVQKFRRDSEIYRFKKPKRKIKSGTFENFSFTKLKQPTLKTFYYGVKLGTIHQGDHHFSILSRNRQGICIPIAAFCLSILKHPDKWTQADIDEVLEAGNNLFLESASTQHLHGDSIKLKLSDLRKYCKIGTKKVRFVVSEPEVSGMVRSNNKKIYNLTKALNIFFGKYRAGILETDVLSVAIWKDKNFYFFDPGPRTIDLYTHHNGCALMANFYDTTAIISVLLNRSNLENLPFIIYSIEAFKVLSRDAEEVDSSGVIAEIDNFQVLDEEKAVALGSFDLADKCFGFSRNKQALTMGVVALVYSKITPPNSWHKGTIDKIVIIGNQLYLECVDNDTVEELKPEDLPAVFTIGPYVVEIYISPNRFNDFMFKKSKCMLTEHLETFFQTNSNSIVQIDNSTIAVWKQRNIYHCFDPYSRNGEGLKCRNGSACVSMHTTLNSLMSTITKNFDSKDMIFHVHALKVCKIHRDPSTKELFPKCLTMNDYPIENFKRKMKKSKRRATAKSVTVDHDTRATFIEELPPGSILEVGSAVKSITLEDLPPMFHKEHQKVIKLPPNDKEFVADLDSPSLSDTQIEPPDPLQEETVIDFMDLDSFQLTEEEKEMTQRGEGKEGGEDGGRRKSIAEDAGGAEDEEAEGGDEWYMAAAEYTQIGSHSLLSRLSQEVNTEPFLVEIPEEEILPIVRNIKAICKKKPQDNINYDFEITPEPDVTLSEELAKETNFMDLPDGSQIILGGTNIAKFGSDLEFMAPFICIMATAVAKKYCIESWTKDVVDYVLKCGSELYTNSNTRYDQNYKLEIPRISLGRTDFSIRVNYIFDTFLKPRVLAMALNKMLFPQYQAGILVTPTYSCTIFYKNHLYYLYDGFGNNEVGLGKGASNEGVAFLARFQDIDSLVCRILHNKTKREEEENIEYNRFVLSSCYVKQLPKELEDVDYGEGDDEIQQDGEEVETLQLQSFKKSKEEEKEKPPPKIGYHLVGKLYKIQGTKAVGGEKNISNVLKEDYFVSICACLMLLNNPHKKWDDRKVDTVIDQGLHIFDNCKDLNVCSRKTIKNVLIEDYFFDIIAYRMNFSTYKSRRTLKTGIETMLTKKHQNFILQFPNRSYAVSIEDKIYHLFDPSDSDKASWTRYKSFPKFVRRLKKGLVSGGESYNFHCIEIASITKAPKQVIISNRTKRYRILKDKKPEFIGKPFYEEMSWLCVDPLPWSWMVNKTNLPLWNHWYMDFPDDLYSLFGSLSPLDPRFPEEYRQKQTLGNLVVAIGMIQIYELKDWNTNIMDAILINGDQYFQESIKDISDENYEIAFEDLKNECTIFPYTFQLQFAPIVEGTIFLVRVKQFNLYKALRFFFDDYVKRFGVIYVAKDESDKRLYAFGKVKESEYFMYDCTSLGPPMYVEKDCGVPYILRTTTLNRLLHVLTLTLRGGDFYIFEVGLSELKPVS